MTDQKELAIHPVADLLPTMSAEDFAKFKADIETNGLIEPVWLHQGKIIDGRHRYRACRELGIPVTTRDWTGTGSLESFVLSLNLSRRHLTADQKAAIAAKFLLPAFKADAKRRQAENLQRNIDPDPKGKKVTQSAGGRSSELAGKAAGVNPLYVKRAAKIAKSSPETLEKIIKGEARLADAAQSPPKSRVKKPRRIFSTSVKLPHELHDAMHNCIKRIRPQRPDGFNAEQFIVDAVATAVAREAEGPGISLAEYVASHRDRLREERKLRQKQLASAGKGKAK